MRFEILNVEHGFCAYAVNNNGATFLFDCGHSNGCRPSQYLPSLGIRSIQRLFITNYDEDHISDLPNILATLNVEILTRNASLIASQLRSLKEPPISRAMESLLSMINGYTGEVTVQQLEPLGFQVSIFNNNYPSFTDTNNLSVLIFLDAGNICFALSGDLERAGWIELLRNPQVQYHLSRTNVFIASHHGRENGYCKEVFKYCKPSLIVMSDGSVQYGTQQMAGIYGQHASGEWFTTPSGQEWRKVVTTRKDGNISWTL